MAEKSMDARDLWSSSRAALKFDVVFPAVTLSNPWYVLRHLLSELPQNTSFTQYHPFPLVDVMSHLESLVLNTLIPSFKKLSRKTKSLQILTLD